MSETIEPRFTVLSEDERKAIDFGDFLMKVTVEFGPAANLPKNATADEVRDFIKKHADGDQSSFFHFLMAYLRDYQEALIKSGVPHEEAPPVTITVGLCGGCTFVGRPGMWTYPSLCTHC